MEVVEGAGGVGFQVGEGAGFRGQAGQEFGQHDVLVQVGGVPGVVGVLVGEHGRSAPRPENPSDFRDMERATGFEPATLSLGS